MTDERVVLVTGTSSGIGASVRTVLAAAGWRVFGSSRHPDGSDPEVLALDVTDDGSVRDAVAEVLDRAGRIDAVVNNAGVDTSGAVEETTVADAEALFATNYFGVHRVTREVLPRFRQQGGGRVVVVGSLAGIVPLPFNAQYAAAKHAIEGWIDTLQFEVEPFGIHCTVIEPGYIRTELRERARPVQTRIAAYDTARRRAEAASDRSVANGSPPETVADAVRDVLAAKRPPLHRLVGSDARTATTAKALLPDRMFRAGLRRRY